MGIDYDSHINYGCLHKSKEARKYDAVVSKLSRK